MTKSQLRALATQAALSHNPTRIAIGLRSIDEHEMQLALREDRRARLASEIVAKRRTERDQEDDDRVTVVTDHCGREHIRNSQGEWLS